MTKRTWRLFGAMGIAGAVLLRVAFFLLAPAEERISNLVMRDIYDPQQIVSESDNASKDNSWHVRSVKMQDASGMVTFIFCEVYPTSPMAKRCIDDDLKVLRPLGKPSVLIGESALLYKARSGQNNLIFQRNNLYVHVCALRGPPTTPDSVLVASMESTAQTLDQAIVARHPGVQVSTVSNGYGLKAEVDWWWRMHGRDALERFLPW